MKKLTVGIVVLALGASWSLAEQQAMMGTIVSESSVACGNKETRQERIDGHTLPAI